MALKLGFYIKATALLLTLAVSALVGCGGGSYVSADSDAGVTDVTGGQSSVISSQSSVRTSTGGQSAVSSRTSDVGQTGGTSAVSSQSSVIGQTGGTSAVTSQSSVIGQTGGTTSVFTNYEEIYENGTLNGGSTIHGFAIGECPVGQFRSQCAAIKNPPSAIVLAAFTAFDSTCSDDTLKICESKSTNAQYTYVWQCSPNNLNPSESTTAATGGSAAIAATGGSAAIAATGGSAAIAATGGAAAIAATGGASSIAATGGASSISPSTYTVTYLNQVVSQSTQAPGTCPSGQTVTTCTCVISGMQSTLTSCNPTACQIENSKQYPQSTFTWSCV